MHNSYHSILPCGSKLLQKKWDETYYNEHRRKVSGAVPVVDTRAPQTYLHLHFKMKKLQLEEEKLALIERDNRMLLEKMSQIMRTHGRIDNRNQANAKSLSREKKQRELIRITEENHEILNRILSCKPQYSSRQWRRHWDENSKYMENISQWPPEWWRREATRGLKRYKSLPPLDPIKESSPKGVETADSPAQDQPMASANASSQPTSPKA